MLTEFATVILYTQLLLANPGRQQEALLWTDEEVAQGFAWGPDEVAFGIPDHDGECLVSVTTDARGGVKVADDALWAIAVPFTARGNAVEVGTVMLERPVPITPGRYQVVFQARPGNPGHAYRLEVSLSPSDEPVYAIPKQGSLGTDHVLRQQARSG